MDNRAIGVYDSGVGGLSLWRELKHSLPNESIVYLGDGLHCPYGERSRDEILSYAQEAVERFVAMDCKMVVIACNTATSASIATLRERYPSIPFVGMEPAIKPACEQTKSGVVAVLATKRSLESEIFTNKIERYAVGGIKVVTHVGDGFVEIVERGEEQSDKAFNVVKPVLEDIMSNDVDKIVLGCTHYPFLMPHFEQLTRGRDIDIIDPSPAIVSRIEFLLDKYDMSSDSANVAKYEFLTFADQKYREMLVKRAEKL